MCFISALIFRNSNNFPEAYTSGSFTNTTDIFQTDTPNSKVNKHSLKIFFFNFAMTNWYVKDWDALSVK